MGRSTMTLDRKIKQAAFYTGLSHLLRGKSKSAERTARNILDFGLTINHESPSEQEKIRLCRELQNLIKTTDLKCIYQWSLEQFHL